LSIDLGARTMMLKVAPQLGQADGSSYAVKLEGTLLSYLV